MSHWLHHLRWFAVAAWVLAAGWAPAGEPAAEALRRAAGVRLVPLSPIGKPEQDRGAGLLEFDLSPLDQDQGLVLRRIAEAEAAADRREWIEAAGKFQTLLDLHTHAVVPVGERLHMPVWRYATLRLRHLPRAALEAYRRSYGPAAQRALEAAAADRNTDALLALTRRYGATEAGLEALETLASLELERGRPASAARLWTRRLEFGEPTPGVLLRLGHALAGSGEPRRLTALLGAVRQHAATERVTLAGREMTLAEALAAPADATADPEPSPLAENAVRPKTLLWQVQLQPDESPPTRRGAPRRPPEMSMFAPAIAGNRLWLQSPDRLEAIDWLTGRPVWRLTLGSEEVVSNAAQFLRPQAREREMFSTPGVLGPRLTDRAVLVAFPTQLAERAGLNVGRGVFGRIDALPRDAEGETPPTMWSVNARAETEVRDVDARLPALRFVGPPVQVGDTVVVPARPAQSDSEAFLIGYDAVTGERVWRVKVASAAWVGEVQGWSYYAAGSPVVAHQGVAYYGSNLGTVVAVDSVDGSLLWAARYDSERDNLCELETIGGQKLRVTAPPNPIIVSGDRLYALPSDSGSLLALDRHSGGVLWKRPRREDEAVYLHLLAADERSVYLSGSAVGAVDAASGATRWRSVLFDAFPAGRGVVARDRALAPIEGGLAVVDLRATGRLVESIRWRDWRGRHIESGNLALHRGRLVVTGRHRLSVFAPPGAEKQLEAEIARRPNDARLRLELGSLLAGQDKLDGAITHYTAARELAAFRWAPAADALQQALALSQEDRAAAATAALRRARMLDRSGQPAEALRVLHHLLARYGDVALVLPDGRTCRADLAAGADIGRLLAARGEALYQPLEALAKAEADRHGDEAERLEALARLYPNSAAALERRLTRAERAVAQGRLADASGELLAVRRLRPGFREERVRALLAKVEAPPDRSLPEPKDKTLRLLDAVWKQNAARRLDWASVPDAPPGNAAGRRPEADYLLVAEGKELQAYHPRTGKPTWRIERGFLGVSFQGASVAPSGQPRPEVEFHEIIAGYPAEKAGAKPGDLLISFDGHRIRKSSDLVQLCATTPPGKEIDLVVVRNGRRVTLRPVIGRRLPDAEGRVTEPTFPPEQHLRVVGVTGTLLVAEVDSALLFIHQHTGKLLARTVLGPLPPTEVYGAFRAGGLLKGRGPTPVMGDGLVVAGLPPEDVDGAGQLLAVGLDGKRRWNVSLPGLFVMKMRLRRGQLAVLAGTFDAQKKVSPQLFVLDAFDGQILHHHNPEVSALLEECHLVPDGDRLVLALPGRLSCHDAAANRVVWTSGPTAWAGEYFPEVAVRSGKLLALLKRRGLAAIDPANGKLLWKQEIDGFVQRMVCTDTQALLMVDGERGYTAVAYALENGKKQWETTVLPGAALRTRPNSLPLAEVAGGVLFVAQHLTTMDNRALRPSVAALRISDGKLLRYVGLNHAGGYNEVLGGKLGVGSGPGAGVLGLITRWGLFGFSAVGPAEGP